MPKCAYANAIFSFFDNLSSSDASRAEMSSPLENQGAENGAILLLYDGMRMSML